MLALIILTYNLNSLRSVYPSGGNRLLEFHHFSIQIFKCDVNRPIFSSIGWEAFVIVHCHLMDLGGIGHKQSTTPVNVLLDLNIEWY